MSIGYSSFPYKYEEEINVGTLGFAFLHKYANDPIHLLVKSVDY
jgi:hypothetical protein